MSIKSYSNKGFDSPKPSLPTIFKVQHQVPPKPEISIAWRNLRYEVSQLSFTKGSACPSSTRKPILRRLNGHFRYHSLNGLMGPSGAGKTTLLNVLNGNCVSGLTRDSEIYLNNNNGQIVSYFIEQHVHESLIGQMSVQDVFRYAFKFKNPGSRFGSSMDHHIRNIMTELLLPEDLLSRKFEKCSGGEQKRIAIAQELMSLSKPDFLFVDEPTTGLDSSAAFEVVRCLKQVTDNYRITVIASIHAPSQEVLELFDSLYVLAKGGVAIYSGIPSGIRDTLEQELKVEIPVHEPPVETLLKIACNGIGDSQVRILADKCLESSSPSYSLTKNLTLHPTGIPSNRKLFSISNLFHQLLRMLKLTFYSNLRQLIYCLAQSISLILFLVTFFPRDAAAVRDCVPITGSNNISTSLNSSSCSSNIDSNVTSHENAAFLSYAFMFIGYFFITFATIYFAPIVKVFRNEHRNNWYSLGVFYWSSTVVGLLEMSILSQVCSTLSYFISNQHAMDDYTINWTRLGYFTLMIWLFGFYYQGLGNLIGTVLVDKGDIALITAILANTQFILLNGLTVNIDQSENMLLIQASNAVGTKFLGKIMLWTFYALDKCTEDEMSPALRNYNIEPDKIGQYFGRIVINAILVRVCTFGYMYYKFNTFNGGSCGRRRGGEGIDGMADTIAIDYAKDGDEIPLKISESSSELHTKAEMELKFEQFSHDKILIGWRNLSLYGDSSIYEMGSSVSKKFSASPKPILRNLNGQFRFGTLNGLMGTSGAGKTSLLRVLNGQCKTKLSDSTRFYLSRFTKITTCFITQEVSGHLMPGLTAKQSLLYASRLKNIGRLDVDHEKIALSLLEELGLSDTMNTKVDRCSGGERKRLALALELTSLQMPNLVCIDEPTSGLDSNSAEIVISCLHKLTRTHNLTIIASIHQPNIEILRTFDQLYVLARGGVCVYSGHPDSINLSLSKVPEVNFSEYPIEVLIKHSCEGNEDLIVRKLIEVNEKQFTKDNGEFEAEVQSISDGVQRNRNRFSFRSSWILTVRYWHYILGYLWKEWAFYLCIYISLGISLTQIFQAKIVYPSGCVNPEEDDTSGNASCAQTPEAAEALERLLDSYRYTYHLGNTFILLIMMQASLTFKNEFYHYFRNEHRNGWYSSGAFYLTKCIYDMIPIVPVVFVHVLITDYFEEVRPGVYWHIVGIILLGAFATQGLGQIASLLSGDNTVVHTSLMVLCYTIFVMISNFFITLSKLNYVYQFMAYFSIPRFTFEALILLQYGFGRCTKKEMNTILYVMGLEDPDYFYCICMLLFNIVVYKLIALWLMVRRVNPKEDRRIRVDRIMKFRLKGLSIGEKEKKGVVIADGLSATDQQFRIQLTRV